MAAFITPTLPLHPPRHHATIHPTMRQFWVQPLSKPVLTTSLESSITHFLFPDSPTHTVYSTLGQYDTTILSADGTFPHGIHRKLTTSADVDALLPLAGVHHTIIVECTDWSSIPIENLLAEFQTSPTELFTIVHDTSSAEAMFGMLESGVDGCILRTDAPEEVIKFAKLRESLQHPELFNFVSTEVLSVVPVGSGERVCIDTCSLLSVDEGLLVGSSSQALFHVLAETAVTPYVASRPFRINAGPVHSYTLLPGGRTCYLCELSAGDHVLVTNPRGECRVAIVGRSKIETRPLLMVSVKTEEGMLKTVFLQNAETVRVSLVDGMKSVTSLETGDRLLLRVDDIARHTGIPISEKLLEK